MPDFDLIIIGGGPAGITAGIYAARKKLKTLLITKDFVGQVGRASVIDNYPGFEKILGPELMEKFINHLKNFKVEIKEGEIKEIKKNNNLFEVETIKKEKFLARSLIVASGRNPRPLKIPGEEEFFGQGVSYCALCDAPLFKDKIVAVIGGGNSGFMAAFDLEKYAKKIYLLEFSSKIRADEVYQESAKASKKIEIILNAKAQEIKGKEKVEKLLYQDRISEKKKEIFLDGIFVEIGSLPATSFLGNLVDFNETGEIIIDSKNNQTKTPGLFAAGDVTNIKVKQIIVAAAEGAKAALSACEYLEKRG